MKLLVLSEGSRDVGGADSAYEGAVRVLSRRVLEEREGRDVAEHEISAARLPRPHTSTKGPAARLRLALAEMRAFGCDSLAIVTDADGSTERLAAWTAERKAVAQQHGELPVAIGVAVQTVEAWLLADETAMNALSPVPLCSALPSPESIWGPARTASHPKTILEGHLKSAQTRVEAPYDAIASRARLKHVEDRCPSFAKYASELRERVK